MRQNKIVFVITSVGLDIYSAMTRIAISSIRLSNPQAAIEVVCDKETDKATLEKRDPLRKDVDRWLVITTPSGDAGFRNRYLKTNLRSTIEGPYLFLDSDIVVRDDLKELFELEADIAAARNHSQSEIDRQIWSKDLDVFSTLGWERSNDYYLNGGVLYVNDTPSAYMFYEEWHRRWLQSYKALSSYRDQPALNSAIFVSRPDIVVLENKFNAQIRRNHKEASDAVVWHYYASVDEAPITQFDVLTSKLLDGGSLDSQAIAKLVTSFHPWRRECVIDDWIARRVNRRGRLIDWETKWFAGNKVAAIRQLFQGINRKSS